jgi:hypothetical protein
LRRLSGSSSFAALSTKLLAIRIHVTTALIGARFGQEEAAIDHFHEFLAAKPSEGMGTKS